LLALRDVTVRQRSHDGTVEVLSLKGVSLQAHRGEAVALVGDNGAGKSTLLQLAAGVLEASAGEVWIAGRNVTKERRPWERSLRAQVGIAFQYPERGFFAATVREEVGFTPAVLGGSPTEVEEAVTWALSLVGLDAGYLARSPFRLSGGEKRRVALAGAVAHRPSLLLLDEPEAGMDQDGKRRIKGLIERMRAGGAAVVVATHDVAWALGWADRVILLDAGRVKAAWDVRTGLGEEAAELLKLYLWDLGLLHRLFREAVRRGADLRHPYKDAASFVEALCGALRAGKARGGESAP